MLALTFKKLDLDYSSFKEIFSDHFIVAVTDPKEIIVYANQKFCDLSKYSEDELLGQNHRILKSDEHSDEFFTKMWDTISSGKIWEKVKLKIVQKMALFILVKIYYYSGK